MKNKHIIKIIDKLNYRFRININRYDSIINIDCEIKDNNYWELLMSKNIPYEYDVDKIKNILFELYNEAIEKQSKYEDITNIFDKINEVEILN